MTERNPYDADQWQQILKIVGPIDAQTEKRLRGDLTRSINIYWDAALKMKRFGSGKAERDRWSELEAKAADLVTAIASIRYDWLNRDDEDVFAAKLKAISASASQAVDIAAWFRFDFVRRVEEFSESRDPGRKALYLAVLEIWAMTLNQPLTYSRKGSVQGRLPRFFQTTLRPVLGDKLPGGEAIAKIIDQKRGKPRAIAKVKKTMNSNASGTNP